MIVEVHQGQWRTMSTSTAPVEETTAEIVAVYAKAGAEQNVYILIAGIVLLMLGVYRISKNIPSKNDQETNEKNSQESWILK